MFRASPARNNPSAPNYDSFYKLNNPVQQREAKGCHDSSLVKLWYVAVRGNLFFSVGLFKSSMVTRDHVNAVSRRVMCSMLVRLKATSSAIAASKVATVSAR
jgi:hypothetical protein